MQRLRLVFCCCYCRRRRGSRVRGSRRRLMEAKADTHSKKKGIDSEVSVGARDAPNRSLL
jgi:hypothetical protein